MTAPRLLALFRDFASFRDRRAGREVAFTIVIELGGARGGVFSHLERDVPSICLEQLVDIHLLLHRTK